MSEQYITDFNEYASKIQKRYKELNEELSEVDLEQQDILHYLENEKCSAVTMVKITKKLKDLREKRRVIKNELTVVSVVYARVGGSSKLLKEPDIPTEYNYRTEIMKEIIG